MNRRDFIKSAIISIGAATVPLAVRYTVIKADNSITNLTINDATGYRIIDGYIRIEPPKGMGIKDIPGEGELQGVTIFRGTVYAIRNGHCYCLPVEPGPDDEWKELTLDNPDYIP